MRAGVRFPAGRRFDAVTLGRANMDLYTEEGYGIDTTPTFTRSLGGSPANIAAAMARLGKRVAMVTRVADDPTGDAVLAVLESVGVETGWIGRDTAGLRTSVAFAETKAEGSRTVLYRNGAADLALAPGDIDRTLIADARLLVVSGQALATTPVRDAAFLAIEYARNAGTIVALDIDYRPYSWESPEAASVTLTLAAERSNVVIGTREEFDALEVVTRDASRSDDDDAATAARLTARGVALVVVKRGADGSRAFTSSGEQATGPVFRVAPSKPYGAGDAFAGALLTALLDGEDVEDGLRDAAAAASFNIARKRCAEDMPRRAELTAFIREAL